MTKNDTTKSTGEQKAPETSIPPFKAPSIIGQKQSIFGGRGNVGGSNFQKGTPKFSPGRFQHQHKG